MRLLTHSHYSLGSHKRRAVPRTFMTHPLTPHVWVPSRPTRLTRPYTFGSHKKEVDVTIHSLYTAIMSILREEPDGSYNWSDMVKDFDWNAPRTPPPPDDYRFGLESHWDQGVCKDCLDKEYSTNWPQYWNNDNGLRNQCPRDFNGNMFVSTIQENHECEVYCDRCKRTFYKGVWV